MRIACLLVLFSCKTTETSSVTIPPPSTSASLTQPAASGAPPPATTTAIAPTGSDTSCSVDADCTYGEMSKDITKASDCPCLLGCPGIAMNRTTNDRRQSQYTRFCNPSKNGAGRPCPIDDCAPPPKPRCVSGVCR